MSKLEKYQSDPVHEDLRAFQLELNKIFPDVKPTSTFRANAKTKEGKISRHAHGEAIDYSLNNKEIKDYLWNTKEGVSLLNKYGLGLLDESEKGNQKWGNAIHIGKDTALVQKAKDRYNELHVTEEQPIRGEFTNYDNLIQSSNLASVPPLKEETEQKQPQVQEIQQKQAPLPEFQTVAFTPIEQPAQEDYPLKDINSIYAEVSNFVDNPLMQQGGVINDNRGQWEHPGEITRIQSPNITMKNVKYPVLGISEQTGEKKLMMPDLNYFFKNTNSVVEFPLKLN